MGPENSHCEEYMHHSASRAHPPTFIDLFSGCGGLSLGLSQANWQGLFAVEKATDAFKTFNANFLSRGARHRFRWPSWLEERAHSIDDVLENHRDQLKKLRGSVDLIAGGPPCQGFSFAGKRNEFDPRNKMFERYVDLVAIVRPKVLVLENVPGMGVVHATGARNGRGVQAGVSYYNKLLVALEAIGYKAEGRILDASTFGVPQRRPRLVVIGLRKDVASRFDKGPASIFEKWIEESRIKLLAKLDLPERVTVKAAISDLVIGDGPTVECDDVASRRGFRMPLYKAPRTTYQRLMHDDIGRGRMDSLRLANHSEDVLWRFAKILRECRRGVSISDHDRARLGMLKHRTVPMSPDMPAPTITTLPDDILHYSDPRILSVRECARIQSFPDWFTFHGKYTTGGERRRVDCPRYTQVGNAVPPLMARVIGLGVRSALAWAESEALKESSRVGGERSAVAAGLALAG